MLYRLLGLESLTNANILMTLNKPVTPTSLLNSQLLKNQSPIYYFIHLWLMFHAMGNLKVSNCLKMPN